MTRFLVGLTVVIVLLTAVVVADGLVSAITHLQQWQIP
jgi:hypothetical protein